MICPLCHGDSIVIRTYHGTQRTRLCLWCKAQWTTIERLMELTHIPPQMALELDIPRQKNRCERIGAGGSVEASSPAPVTDNVGTGAEGRPGRVR